VITDDFSVRADATPNPNSRKFTTNRVLGEGRAQTYASPEEAFAAPLARDLLAVAGVKSVFILRDFVTITREPDAAWETIAAQVEAVLHAHFGE